MYGECKQTPSGTLPCINSEPAVTLRDFKALKILKRLCPNLYAASNTKTCCDAKQLYSLDRDMGVVKQLFSKCPSCLHNFMNIYCQMTCSPTQSAFLKVTGNDSGSVRSLDYVISRDFTYGMFNSCRNVKLPSANDKALSVICGRVAKDCTPENLLNYLGSTSNGHTPFDISFTISNKNVTIGREVYYPMNETTSDCLDTCSKTDCGIPKLPRPLPCPGGSCFDGHVRPIYREEQIVITRPNNHTVVRHHLPIPLTGTVNYTSLFDKEFLHLLLDFQDRIKKITVKYENQLIRLEDICYKPRGDACAEISVLEYWQNDYTAIDKIKMDEEGFFVIADYLDHLTTCSSYPWEYDNTLKIPCVSTSNQTIYPNMVFAGYGGANGVEYYNNSIAFVTTFLVQNYQDDRMNAVARAWEAVFREFVETFPKTNMTVSVHTPAF